MCSIARLFFLGNKNQSFQIAAEMAAVSDSGYSRIAGDTPAATALVIHLRGLPCGRQPLFDLRQNSFHLFFAEGAHGLGLDVSQ